MNKPTRIAVGEEIMKLAQEFDFFVLNTDTKSSGLEIFKNRYPDREATLGIAEQNLIATAAGISSNGIKVIVSTFAVFLSLRALEQIRSFVAHPKLNVTILASHTGLQVGGDGATHAAVEDLSLMRAIPNMTILQPSDEISARALTKFALQFDNPLYIRLHRNSVRSFHNDDYEFKYNVPDIICSSGLDVVIMTTGIVLEYAIDLHDKLKKRKIKSTVLDFITVKPLNEDVILFYANKAKILVTIEDNNIIGGFGSSINDVIVNRSKTKFLKFGIQDRFSSSGSPNELYKDNKMDVESMYKSIIKHIST
ncbi:transketolase family protein [Enterococcus cecorum]|uniref:transketolase family protein n=1 Tax=Enterococcus cecorum TaxID=44008 RepID=UPI00148D5103|nr:transketolase C-terminal domain-containing protein [Enterococcus cecorum]